MTASLEELERRVAAMEDVAAIIALKHRYLRACDRKQPEEVRACFVPDAVIDFEGFPRFDNRDAFVDVYAQFGCADNIMDMHHLQNPMVTLTGPDSATGAFDLYFFQIDTKARTLIQLACAYDDSFVRRDGRWWLSASKSRRLSVLTEEVSSDGLVRVTGLGKQTQGAFGQEAVSTEG